MRLITFFILILLDSVSIIGMHGLTYILTYIHFNFQNPLKVFYRSFCGGRSVCSLFGKLDKLRFLNSVGLQFWSPIWFLTTKHHLVYIFCNHYWPCPSNGFYYDHWLPANQIVTLTHRPTDPVMILKRLDNRKKLNLLNKNTARKIISAVIYLMNKICL